MKCLFAILFAVLFFLPAAKGQGVNYEAITFLPSGTYYINFLDSIRKSPKQQLRIGDNRGNGTVYMVDGVIVDTIKPLELIPQTWLNTNTLTLLTKIYTEKNFQYYNLEYFISTPPQLQR